MNVLYYKCDVYNVSENSTNKKLRAQISILEVQNEELKVNNRYHW